MNRVEAPLVAMVFVMLVACVVLCFVADSQAKRLQELADWSPLPTLPLTQAQTPIGHPGVYQDRNGFFWTTNEYACADCHDKRWNAAVGPTHNVRWSWRVEGVDTAGKAKTLQVLPNSPTPGATRAANTDYAKHKRKPDEPIVKAIIGGSD